MIFNHKSLESIETVRQELIEDTYALAIGGCPAAILEAPDIERMTDAEVLKEAKKRGLI